MGPFATVVLIACLSVLRWLFYVVGGLLGLLVGIQQVRGTDAAEPLPLVAAGGMMLLLGWLSGRLAAWLRQLS